MATNGHVTDKHLEAESPKLPPSRSTSQSLQSDKEKEASIPPLSPTLSRVDRTDSQVDGHVREIDVGTAEKGEVSKRPPPGIMDPASFPDGGVKAWTTVLGGFCALFVSFGGLKHHGSLSLC